MLSWGEKSSAVQIVAEALLRADTSFSRVMILVLKFVTTISSSDISSAWNWGRLAAVLSLRFEAVARGHSQLMVITKWSASPWFLHRAETWSFCTMPMQYTSSDPQGRYYVTQSPYTYPIQKTQGPCGFAQMSPWQGIIWIFLWGGCKWHQIIVYESALTILANASSYMAWLAFNCLKGGWSVLRVNWKITNNYPRCEILHERGLLLCCQEITSLCSCGNSSIHALTEPLAPISQKPSW